MHCVSLRTIFASLAPGNERVHNERNFRQAKLDSEIKVRFLLNERGNIHFLLHNLKSAQNRYSVMQIMTAKTTTLRTLHVHVVLNSAICPQILHDAVLYARHFLPDKFFSKYYVNKLCFELPQNVMWPMNNARD